MKRLFLIAGVAGICAAAAAAPAAAAPAAAGAAKAQFGCDARGSVCHFQIYYPNGRSRTVVLAGGTKVSIPELRIGKDSYCMSLNQKPVHKCARKIVNATYNN